MSAPDQRAPEVEIKDGKLVCEGQTWSPFGIGVTFVVESLAFAHGRDRYGDPETKVSLGGKAYIECQGLVVAGRPRSGVRIVSFSLSVATQDWLAEDIQGVAPPRGDGLPSRVHLGHFDGDDELELPEDFYVDVYVARELFDAIAQNVKDQSLASLWFSADFVGLYADFPYGQAKDTKLGLAPGQRGGEPARGRLSNIHWRGRPVTLAKPHWLSRWLFPDDNPQVVNEKAASDMVPESAPPPSARSLDRVQDLLSQIAVAARWIGWGLLALALVVAFRLR